MENTAPKLEKRNMISNVGCRVADNSRARSGGFLLYEYWNRSRYPYRVYILGFKFGLLFCIHSRNVCNNFYLQSSSSEAFGRKDLVKHSLMIERAYFTGLRRDGSECVVQGRYNFYGRLINFISRRGTGEPAGVLQIGTGSDFGALTVSAFSSVGHGYLFHVFILYKLSDI